MEYVELDTETVRQMLQQLGELCINWKPEMQDILDRMRQKADKRFEQSGPGWTPWAESTRRGRERMSKRGKAANGGILELSSALRNSVTKPNAPSSIQTATNDEATLGSTLSYAAIQNFGGTINTRGHSITIPARQFLDITEADAKEYEAVLLRGIQERIDISTRSF